MQHYLPTTCRCAAALGRRGSANSVTKQAAIEPQPTACCWNELYELQRVCGSVKNKQIITTKTQCKSDYSGHLTCSVWDFELSLSYGENIIKVLLHAAQSVVKQVTERSLVQVKRLTYSHEVINTNNDKAFVKDFHCYSFWTCNILVFN